MSVPKSERKPSNMEFFHTAIEMRKQLMFWLLKDFGVKTYYRDVHVLARIYHIEKDDKTALQVLLNKYNVETDIIDQYPKWLIDKYRSDALNTMRNIINEVSIANSIYIMSEAEYTERRIHWDLAIGYCEALAQILQEIVEILPVDVNKYMPLMDLLSKEKGLIKGVRKADNKRKPVGTI